MTSINPKINALHSAYVAVSGFEMPLNPISERWWFEAINLGISCHHVKLVIQQRRRDIAGQLRHPNSVLLRNICGSDEAIQGVIEEYAMITAKMRIKKDQTSRPTNEIPQNRPSATRQQIDALVSAMRIASR